MLSTLKEEMNERKLFARRHKAHIKQSFSEKYGYKIISTNEGRDDK